MTLSLQAALLASAVVYTLLLWRRWRGGEGIAAALVLPVVLLVGAAIRLQGIGGFLINPDEAMFLQTANRATLGDVFGTSLYHAHPPASYFVYHFAGKISTDILWMRMLSFAAGVGMIALAWAVGRAWLGDRGALVLAWMVAFSPGLVELSSVSRNYTFAFLCLLASLLGLVRFLREGGWKWFALWTLGSAAAFSFLYSIIVVVAAMNGAACLYGIGTRKGWRWWAMVVGAQIPAAALFLFYWRIHIVPFGNLRAESYNTSWMAAQFATGLGDFLRNTRDLFETLATEPLGLVYTAIALAGIVLLVRARRWVELAALVLPFALALLFVLAGKLPYGGTRHTLYLFPFCFGLVAAAACAVPMVGRWRWAVCGLLVLHAVIATVDAALLRNRQELPVRSAELQRALAVLDREAGPSDFVLIDEQSALVLSHHLPEVSSWYWETEPRVYTRGDLRFVYIPHTRWFFKAPQLVVAHDRAIEAFSLPSDGRVWVLHAGWEEQEKLRGQIEKRVPSISLPETGFEPGPLPGSWNLLFAINAADIDAVRAAFPEWEHRH